MSWAEEVGEGISAVVAVIGQVWEQVVAPLFAGMDPVVLGAVILILIAWMILK